MSYAALYLAMGIGFYVGASLAKPRSFWGVGKVGIVRGVVLGILLWPVGMALLTSLQTLRAWNGHLR